MDGRYRRNTLSNVATMVVSLVVGMWLTRYLLHELGAEQYGLIPLAVSASAFLSLLTTALTTTVGRYLTMELGAGNIAAARRTFHTVLLGATRACLILLPVVLTISLLAPELFEVPAGAENPSRWLFLFVSLSVLLSAVTTVFSLASFARNRFDLRNGVQIAAVAVRVGLTVGLFAVAIPSVTHVGIGYFAGAIVTLLGGIWLWRRLTPELTLSGSRFDRTLLIEVAGMATWVIVSQAGITLFKNVDIFLINKFLGNTLGGEYGIVLQIIWLVPTLAATAATPLQPPIFEAEGRGDAAATEATVARGSRLLSVWVGIITGMFAGFGHPFVRLWLGVKFQHLFMPMLVGVFLFSLAQVSQPLMTVMVARKRHRLLGSATVIVGLGHILTCLVLLAFADLGYLPIVASSGLWVLVNTHGVVPKSLRNALPKACAALWRDTLRTVIVAAAPAALGLLWGLVLPNMGWFGLALGAALAGLGVGAAWVLFVATPEELGYLRRLRLAGKPPLRWLLDLRFRLALVRNRRAQSTFTLFLRLPSQFRALTGPVLQRLRPTGDRRPLRILVLGCSNGAEPYSIASQLAAVHPDLDFSIDALDIDPEVVEYARRGRYSRAEVYANPAVDADFVNATFCPPGDSSEFFEVRPELRARVRFAMGNALDAQVAQRLGAAEIVFAQNFLVHFPRRDAAHAFGAIAGLVASPGFLFVDGMDADVRQRCAAAAGLTALDCDIERIHAENSRTAGWPYAYWGVPPLRKMRPDWKRRHATVFVRAT